DGGGLLGEGSGGQERPGGEDGCDAHVLLPARPAADILAMANVSDGWIAMSWDCYGMSYARFPPGRGSAYGFRPAACGSGRTERIDPVRCRAVAPATFSEGTAR